MKILLFLLISAGLFLICGVTPEDLFPPRRESLRQGKREASRSVSRLKSVLKRAEYALLVGGEKKPHGKLLSSSVIAALFGAAAGELTYNMFLIPVFAAAASVIPVTVINWRWNCQCRKMDATLEDALNAVTAAYMRSENSLLRAVEESLPQMRGSAKRVFQTFFVQATMIDANISGALEQMKFSSKNPIIKEWIAAAIRCQTDQTLKPTLPLILDKFADAHTIRGEIEVLMAEPRRVYVIMLCAGVFAPFLLRVLSMDWWTIMTSRIQGQAMLAGYVLCVVMSLFVSIPPLLFEEREER